MDEKLKDQCEVFNMTTGCKSNKVKFALLSIGLILSLGMAASDCIKVFVKDNSNGEAVSGAAVFLDGANKVGETNSTGWLIIPGNVITQTPNNVHNVSIQKGSRVGWATVQVPPGSCPSTNVSLFY